MSTCNEQDFELSREISKWWEKSIEREKDDSPKEKENKTEEKLSNEVQEKDQGWSHKNKVESKIEKSSGGKIKK